ncbi:hypothetical protein K0T92_22915 [Paenibacillus oenotherae]|uniref:Mannosyl-glycoprotein endo-beta-N-acetylglucosaminidase n=1 Tax=Paenibacillus oenotherae TaxID=1435645 RepID=A0ABS7DCA9_9BACL|nr:hypothetical protein [Paenibacillus oenotherae]MBW7477575.1 hypothetical protein [Paenibacillus oenotherae]
MRTDGATVLTPTDIGNIRHYVKVKYRDLPSHRHAEIVADAMRQIVLKQLPDFTNDVKRKLAAELLREVVAAEQRPVGAEHIFSRCLSLSLEDPELLEPLQSWTEQRLNLDMDAAAFRGLLAAASNADAVNGEDSSAWSRAKSHAAGLQSISGGETGLALASVVGQVIELPLRQHNVMRTSLYAVLSLLLVITTTMYGWHLMKTEQTADPLPIAAPIPTKDIVLQSKNELPAELQYIEVDRARLTAFLQSKKSILADAPYMNAILDTAREFDIHPLFLFAITGQEQGFVPRDHKQAKKIANNPFNVFHSWEEYNTTIKQSAAVAARTIMRLSKDRPDNRDAFTWINREYAEDPNWSNGVRSIFKAMKRHLETDTP